MSESDGAPSTSELASARPAFVPEVRRVRPAPSVRFFGPTAAVGVVVGGILVWHLAPPAREPVALEAVVEVDPVDAVPEAVVVEAAPPSVEPAPAVEAEADPSSPPPSGAPLPNELLARAIAAPEEREEREEEAERAEPTEEPAAEAAEDEPGAEPAMGRLFVMVSGGYADLYVDGAPIGTSPTAVHVPAGRHVVRAVPLGDAAEQTMTVTVPPRETVHVRIALDPPPPDRTVVVAVNPPAPERPSNDDAPFVYPTPPHEEEDRYDIARACAIAGDHSCVVRELGGRCTQAREFELLIASMGALGGYSRELERAMREYRVRFPTGREAERYRLHLIEHGASVE